MPRVPMEEIQRLGLVGMAPGMNNFLGDAVNKRQVQVSCTMHSRGPASQKQHMMLLWLPPNL
jgi:hypothetical protein